MIHLRRIPIAATALLALSAGLPAAESRIVLSQGAPVEIARSAATGTVSFLRVADGEPLADLSPGSGTLDRRARSFLAAQRGLFGIADANLELELRKETRDFSGYRHLTYRQLYRGVPVFAGILRAHFDSAARLRAINGSFIPGIALEVRPTVAAATARTLAIEFARGLQAPPLPAEALVGATPALEVYRTGLDRDVAGIDLLVWRIEVSDGGAVAESVFVDARRGKVIDHFSRNRDALARRAFPGADDDLDGSPDAWPGAPDWLEGIDPIPSGDPERDALLLAAADFHDRLVNGFGRESWDGAGAPLDLVYDFVRSCPNASASPLGYIRVCPGFSTHDVVAHELTHLLTTSTSDLTYRWQSGALNESFSDLFGEALDQGSELASPGGDTDSPDLVRSAGACSSLENPATGLEVVSPVQVAGDYATAFAWYGPRVTAAITAPVVELFDGAGADAHDGCEPILNRAKVAGAIAFANRGNCPDHFKTLAAQAAGAVALVTGNVPSSPNPETWVAPWCGDPLDLACQTGTYSIPSVGVPLSVADALRRQLGNPVVATLAPWRPSPVEDSVRWLIAEDFPSLPGIRDLWTPTCMGSPGKVSDAAYYICDGTDDNGGVHVNSGIPNHAFALLVDGGDYNGVSVPGIGMVKALQIHYRAHTTYLVPFSDFADYATALEAACSDFATAGAPLPDPWGGSPQVVTAADCAAVTAAIAAVEFRSEPASCSFATLLRPDPPPLCRSGAPQTTYVFDWESGASGWTATRRGVAAPAAFHPRDWTIEAGLPDGRPGSAFHAPDAHSILDCYLGLEQTGALVLESPPLTMPAAGPALALAFDHLIATEENWDGANVKLSVDGGPFVPLPALAYSFNPPTGPLYPASSGNTNPLAGERAWHGTDAGSNTGSWGRTLVRLQGLVLPGHTFKLRFELGTDSCYGTGVGWWLDDVRLYSCVR